MIGPFPEPRVESHSAIAVFTGSAAWRDRLPATPAGTSGPWDDGPHEEVSAIFCKIVRSGRPRVTRRVSLGCTTCSITAVARVVQLCDERRAASAAPSPA